MDGALAALLRGPAPSLLSSLPKIVPLFFPGFPFLFGPGGNKDLRTLLRVLRRGVCFPPRLERLALPPSVVVVSPLRASGRTGTERAEEGLIHDARAAASVRGSRRGPRNARAASRARVLPPAFAIAYGKAHKGPGKTCPKHVTSSPRLDSTRDPGRATLGTSPPSKARLGQVLTFGRLAIWLISPPTHGSLCTSELGSPVVVVVVMVVVVVAVVCANWRW